MNHTTKKAVIFDLDGTLVDNRASFAKAYRAMCARYPNLFDEQDGEAEQLLIRFYRSSFARDAYRALCDHLAPHRLPPMELLRKEWGMTYAENAIALPCAEGTLQYLREKSYRIGLLTNGDSARQWAKIHSCGLCTYFDHIIVSGDYPFEKPDPAIYRLSLEGLGVTADEALFVGDTVETDIDGAKQAGIDSLWLTEKKENTAGATYLAENVGALMNLL